MTDIDRLATEGAGEGTVVWADHQLDSRGRGGRTWCSSPAKGVEFSLLLRPPATPEQFGPFGLVAGMAVAQSLEASGVPRLKLKWPNDLLINGRKVGGLLLTSRVSTSRIFWVTLGVGINVFHDLDDLPAGTTSLALFGLTSINRTDLLWRLLADIETAYDAFLASSCRFDVDSYHRRCHLLGEAVTLVNVDNSKVHGVYTGVTKQGALTLERPDGLVLELTVGDIVRGPRRSSASE